MGLGSRLDLSSCRAHGEEIRCLAILEDPLSTAADLVRTSRWNFGVSGGRIVSLSTLMNVPRFKAAWAGFRAWALDHHREEYTNACGLGVRDRACGAFIASMAQTWGQEQ